MPTAAAPRQFCSSNSCCNPSHWRTRSPSAPRSRSRGCITAALPGQQPDSLQTRGQRLLRRGIRVPSQALGLHTGEKQADQGGSALHARSPERQGKAQSQEKRCSTRRRADGREVIPLESEVSLPQFASAFACRNNKPQSTSALIPLPSEDIAKENVHRILRELKEFFKRCLCKQVGEVASPRGRFWPEADEVYLNQGRRDALTKQGFCWPLGMFSLPVGTARFCQAPAV